MTEDHTSRSAGSRIQGLDAIRGFAIGLVLLRHAWPEVFGTAGIVGVVVFFALSGYLITGLLQRDIKSFGRVRFKRFYVHRLFRLMPALIFMLVGFSVIEGVWNILGDRSLILNSVLVGITYTMNVPGIEHGSGALSHLWTLATEEQFYLVWPIVLMFGLRYRKALPITLISIAGSLILCAISIYAVHPETFKVYSLPTSWVSAMLIGAAAKITETDIIRLLKKSRLKYFASASLITLIILSFTPEAKDWPVTYLVIGPAIALLAVAIILYCKSWSELPSSSLAPLHALGKISYAAYLWNYPIANWMGERPLNIIQGTLSIVLTLFAATVSWYLVERPFSALRRRVDKRAQATFNAGSEPASVSPPKMHT